ncbi:hypothetical protein QYM36_011947, partial [Artemia franciscana]
YWWLYKQEEYEKDEAKKSQLALPSVEQQAITNSNDLRKLDAWTYTNKNAVMFVPNDYKRADTWDQRPIPVVNDADARHESLFP